MAKKLTHIDELGQAQMVDIGGKPSSLRTATAEGRVFLQADTLHLIQEGLVKKGDVLTVAQIAGIMGAKRTSELIPLCHPLVISKIAVNLQIDEALSAIVIDATIKTTGQTGVEMEALTAVSISALTIYDMVKAVDRTVRISDIRLLEKRGGVHGDYVAEEVNES